MLSKRITTLLFLGACASSPEAAPTDTAGTDTDSAGEFVEYSDDGLSVSSLEPSRYLGVWYEIATTPSFQEANCTGTTAEYGLIDEETISVHNRCYIGSLDGRLNEIEGTASFADDSFARLFVDFGFGFDAPYNVVELDGASGDEPYQYAAVNSAGFQMWVLSRTPTMDPDLYDRIIDRLEAQDLDTSEFERTEQPTE